MYDDQLSRDKWVNKLSDLKNQGLLDDMARDIEKAKPDTDKIDENDYKFIVYNDDSSIGARINMQFNNFSKVWKIENL